METNLPQPGTHGPQGPLAPPVADLYAYPSFRVRQDNASKHLYITGVVGNRGNIPAHRAVTVAVGATVHRGTEFLSSEKRFELEPGLRQGDLEFVGELRMPLRYRTEGWHYQLEIAVDIFHELSDLTRSNNRYAYDYWAFPAANARRGDSMSSVFASDGFVMDDGGADERE